MPLCLRETTHEVTLASYQRVCKKAMPSDKPFLSQYEFDSTLLAADLIKKRALTEHFKQRAVAKLCTNSGIIMLTCLHPTFI